MRNKIGVMQGRLLPKYQGRYQAHPKGYWEKEFKTAKNIGLDCIEFILDFNDAEQNPLLKAGGVDEILKVWNNTGVSVNTICADYFIEAPLHAKNENEAMKSKKILINLLQTASQIGVTDIVIPCVDKSSLANTHAVDRFVDQIRTILPYAEERNINFSLETDLPPQPFVDLLSRLDSNCITINYDIGNSAALGYNPVEELNAYGGRISDIHIKDRTLGGGPVVLGNGDADFKVFFQKLKEFKYSGPFIMQAYRDDEGIEIFKKQLNWVTPYFNIIK
ncbi:sugar phosphate isomerase/epimerase [Nitrospinae bacterium]|nr:sugar phosphate isomerase/epimerase [Nitrospinota bacterium]